MAAPSRRLVAVTLFAWSLLSTCVAAQDPVFRASVQEVVLDVAVTRGGAPVRGLKPSHFTIIDDGVTRSAARVLHESVPLHLVLCLDTSSSLGADGLLRLQAAADALIAALRPDDRVGLVTFSEAIHAPVLPTVTHAAVSAALRRVLPQGPTAWRDALFVATQLAAPPSGARPVVLLLTDGADTSSWMPKSHLDELIRRSGVVVHGIVLRHEASEPSNRRGAAPPGPTDGADVHRAAIATGGRVWSAGSQQDLRRLFVDALDDLRSRYLVAYLPTEPTTPGWHSVAVRLNGVRADVLARPGYWVPPAP